MLFLWGANQLLLLGPCCIPSGAIDGSLSVVMDNIWHLISNVSHNSQGLPPRATEKQIDD